MAEITRKRIGELLRIVFVLLWYKPEGLPAKDILVDIPKVTQLTDYEKGYLPSSPNIPKATQLTDYEKGYYQSIPNIPRYEKIIRLATIPLVNVGWLIKNNKGRWFITDKGRQACKEFNDAEEFYKEAAKLHNEYFERRRNHPAIFLTLEEAKEKSWEQIQEYLLGMETYEFQVLVADLLWALDYHVAWIAPPGKERGQIDIVAYTDPLGVSIPRIKVQVKHRGLVTTIEGLTAFTSILGNDDFGIFVSSSGFTKDVKDTALTQEYRVTLIDLEDFFDLWVEHYEKLTPEARLRFPLEAINFLSPIL